MRIVGVVVVVLATGCVASSTFVCGDGVVCPSGYRCDEALSLCIDPESEAACAGHADGDPCAVRGLTGTCMGGLCEVSVCGNGDREGGEECDGGDIGDATCLTLGYYEETTGLTCRADCTIDRSSCVGRCGDGIKNGDSDDEQCDGNDLGISPTTGQAATCQDAAFYDAPGLACTPFCRYDVRSCTGTCGDDIQNGDELCDNSLPEESCFDIGFDAGMLTCSDACGFAFDGCGRFGWQFEESLPDVSAPYAIHGAVQNNVLEAWAVGEDGHTSHFNGTEWTPVQVGTADLRSVWVAGVGAAWASDVTGALRRWNGTSWTVDATAPAGITGVWGTSATDVWVITSASGVKRYNGATWSDVGGITGVNLVAIHGSGPDDVWIATDADLVNSTNSVVRRWNGTAWSAPASVGNPTEVRALYSLAPNDAWAVGTHGSLRFLSHWNGSTWTMTLRPTLSGAYTSITASATNDIWLSGTVAPYVEHYDGHGWTPVIASSAAKLFEVGPGHVLAAHEDSIERYTGQVYGVNDPGSDARPSPIIWSTDDGHIIVRNGQQSGLSHFDGNYWAPYGIGGQFNSALSLWGATSTNLWAARNDGGAPWKYNGSHTWVQAVHPVFPNTLLAITSTSNMWGSSANDIWYGGATGTIRHFNGTAWSARNIAGLTASVKKIWGSGPDDVWALSTNDRLFRWTGAWTEVTNVPTPADDMVVAGTNQAIVISAGEAWHGNAAGWMKHDLPNVPEPPTGLVARGPDMVFGVSPNNLFHFNGTRWTLVRMPPQPLLYAPLLARAIALSANRLDITFEGSFTSMGFLRSLVITQPWRCLADETGLCTDGVDNDCDGTLDDRDLECP